MSTNQRGAMLFAIIMAATIFFCGLLPFMILPNAEIAMALPVVQMPGEVFVEDWPSSGFEFTNTLVGTLLADAIVLLLALVAWRKSKGWTNEVPGRFQSFMEALGGGLNGLVKRMAGDHPKVRSTLFPLVATIFIFLLAANWLELLPGVDSIGVLHCAGGHGDQNGYTRTEIAGDLYQLRNPESLFAGHNATTADYDNCHSDGYNADVAYDGVPEVKHLITESDSLHSIAVEYGVTEEMIQDSNSGSEELIVGEELAINLVGQWATKTNDNLYVVTPFVRAAATDLNLTFGLALISFFAIQYFGFSALGWGYLQKFFNIHALGNIKKKPMGAMDFVVGLFEIISELSKVISLAFRLFGNIFAGQLLLFIMAFLVATLLPGIFYFLEVIVGAMQALVFAVLTLVFSAGAMVSHIGDEH